MRQGRFQPLVWPVALLIAGGVTALVAEATTLSVDTVTLYGMLKLVSDLVLVIGVVWLIVAAGRVFLSRRIKP